MATKEEAHRNALLLLQLVAFDQLLGLFIELFTVHRRLGDWLLWQLPLLSRVDRFHRRLLVHCICCLAAGQDFDEPTRLFVVVFVYELGGRNQGYFLIVVLFKRIARRVVLTRHGLDRGRGGERSGLDEFGRLLDRRLQRVQRLHCLVRPVQVVVGREVGRVHDRFRVEVVAQLVEEGHENELVKSLTVDYVHVVDAASDVFGLASAEGLTQVLGRVFGAELVEVSGKKRRRSLEKHAKK